MTLRSFYQWLKKQKFSFDVVDVKYLCDKIDYVNETKTFYIDDVRGFNDREFKLNNKRYLELEVHDTLNCVRILYVDEDIISNIKKIQTNELNIVSILFGNYTYFMIELKQIGKAILEYV